MQSSSLEILVRQLGARAFERAHCFEENSPLPLGARVWVKRSAVWIVVSQPSVAHARPC